jgi:DNA-binding transcriptional MerR regulator
MSGECWRIDDLARRAGVTVDTIRYYARERLLPPPERAGRHKLYGPDHLARLERIRELQDQRFSLAAIRAVLTSDRPGLDGLFLTEGRVYGRDDLVARSGLDPELVDQLSAVGLLPDPAEFGREAYDDADLGLLRAVAELQDLGMTAPILVELARIYVQHFTAIQRDVHQLLAGEGPGEWDAAEITAMQHRLTANVGRLMPSIDRVLNYVHQRTVQRLTLQAIRTAQETGTGVGGVRMAALAALDPPDAR